MPAIIFLGLAVLCTAIHTLYRRERISILEVFLSYLIFFNIGLVGFLGAYAHIFMAAEIAKSIGWAPGSPFQFEVAMANLALGVLGFLAYWFRGLFWMATIISCATFLLGDFVGHLIEYSHGDTAPNNIGYYIWINDLFLPILYLLLLRIYMKQNNNHNVRSFS